LIIRFNVSLNGIDQFFHTFEDTSTDTPGSHDAKPSLNLVHPRRPGWSKMQMKPTMFIKPLGHPFVLVRAIVIQDQVQVFVCGGLFIQSAQELQKFLMAMASVTIPNNFSRCHVQSSKQTGCPIPDIIVSMPLHLSRS
jgi:hypothetical protein